MKGPAYIIDPPTPYEPPEVLWDFLRRLRELGQDDVAVQDVRRQVLGYLGVKSPHEGESSNSDSSSGR